MVGVQVCILGRRRVNNFVTVLGGGGGGEIGGGVFVAEFLKFLGVGKKGGGGRGEN